jgi:L-gulonolactone oxidase
MAQMIVSWGRAHRYAQQVIRPRFLDEVDIEAALGRSANGFVLGHGMGRSYGDTPLNADGALIVTRQLDRIISIDWDSGVLRAEAGLTFDALLEVAVPRGWFPAVVPGTKFVSLGGAVANDVHGKNHHVAGSFGTCVRAIGLIRSDGQHLSLSREQNPELFALTIGGLGLTGFIDWVEIQLLPIAASKLEVDVEEYDGLEAFFDLCKDSLDWPYVVAWIDCFAPKQALGRGLFSRGRFLSSGECAAHKPGGLVWPLETPGFLLNKATISAFNLAYRKLSKCGVGLRVDYDPFFFPLDGIRNWNKLYGHRGFYQHQSLLPPDEARGGLTEMLDEIRRSGQGSFLAVLKNYGAERSPGRLSFAGEGFSLALDFANRGARTFSLLDRLDDIVRRHGGRLYPAKDGRMSGAFFRESYPAWQDLEAARDPAFSSSFWRRVAAQAA